MAKNSDQDGPATDLARQAADKAHQAAGWLADRDPGSLLDEVRSFARRKPGTYLAIALGAGVLAGRLTRGLTAPTDDTPSSTTGSTTTGIAGRAAHRRTDPIRRHRPGERPAGFHPTRPSAPPSADPRTSRRPGRRRRMGRPAR